MKFLADENFPKASINVLRDAQFEVFSIAKECPGLNDKEVFTKAKELKMIILTFDRDFGHIVFRDQLSHSSGLVYFRIKTFSDEEPGEILVRLIKSNINFSNAFTVIEKDNIRQRKI